MKTKLSLLTLFACVAAGTTLFADNENYDGQTIVSGNFEGGELANSSWIESVIGTSDSSVSFSGSDLTGANFAYANIVNAHFDSTSADGATILRDAVFSSATIGTSDSSVSFRGADLTGANFVYANLINIDIRDAIINGVTLAVSTYGVSTYNNFTLEHLYSTASYKNKDLSEIDIHLRGIVETEIDLRDFNLSGASISVSYFDSINITGANLMNGFIHFNNEEADSSVYENVLDLTGVDLRGASLGAGPNPIYVYDSVTYSPCLEAAIFLNTILGGGEIAGFSMASADDSFVIRKYTPKEDGGASISAKIQKDATISGGAVLSVAEGGALDISSITLTFGIDNDDEMISSVSVADGGSVTLASGAKIVIDYAGTFDENTSFAVMNWADSSSIVGLDSLTKGGTLSLLVDGVAYDTSLWNFSTENNALTIFGVATSVDPGPDLPDPDEPIIPNPNPENPSNPVIPQNIVISSGSQNVELESVAQSANFDGSLTVFSGTVSGAGSLNSAGTLTFSGDASAHTGTTSITSGTFTISESAKLGTGAFEVAGTLAISGSRTFSNATSGNGTLRVASGATTFVKDIGVKMLTVAQGASATLSAGVDLTHADAEAQVAGTLNLLGTRTFSAETSGGGVISLASGSDVSFAKAVGVKTLSVAQGATLRGSVSMTHGADAKISLAGTLVLNPDKGEKVSLGGGRVEIASSAKLDLVGNGGSPFARATSAQIDALENGELVTIFEGGAVSGNVLAFLRTDTDLAAYAQNYAVIYDESNGGLSVRVVKNTSALTDGIDTSELSASFVDWALSDADEALNSLATGFVSPAAWNNLSGGNDPLLNAILATDSGTARAILDRLSPKSYAAMVSMPVESFNSDVRSISARLEQRRYDRFSKRAQWEFFAQLQTNSVENDTAPDAPTFDFDTTGLLAGADYKLDQNTMLGIALGASTGEAKVHNGGGKIESTDFRITGFAGKTFEKSFVNAGAQLGYASYDIKRNTDYGNASGDTTGWSAGLFADAGTVVTLSEAKKIYATPYIGLAYMHTQADAFTESGSDKAFDADAISDDSLRARLGCGFSWGFSASGAVWRLGLDVAFSHDFLGDEVDIDVTTQDGTSISETAKALPEDMFSIGPSFNVDVSSSASIYGGYSFNAGTDSSVNHSANVGFRMRF